MSSHRAEQRVAQVVRDLAHIQRRLPKALSDLAAMTPDGWGTGTNDRTSGGGGEQWGLARSTITDQALEYRELYQRIDSLAAELAGITNELLQAVDDVPDLGVDTAADAARLRCSGGEGDWADPTCTRIMVTTVESDLQRGTRLPVCDTCRKRRQRHQWRLEGRYDPTTGGPLRDSEETADA